MRHLINNNCKPFDPTELQTLNDELNALNNDQRIDYRNQNASAIAELDAAKILVVSGPGTGKSHLFLDRVNYWYQKDPQAKVLVTSFVRKLVADLQNDISINDKLSEEQKSNINVSTLHKFARSVVEQNHGTAACRFQPHFRIIGQSWKNVVWGDTLVFESGLNRSEYTWKKFEEQLHNDEFEQSDEWRNSKESYFKLCKFYNAAGFADLILRAKDALSENPQLNESSYFIIDEYQDFNSAEDSLINQLVHEPKGLLVAGDDEQVLYEKLKSGKPTLIRGLYQNANYINGMLPFCSRSSFHITKNAGHFIQQHRDTDCIEKIYLPIKNHDNNSKVQIIACATASAAADYIDKFVTDNKIAIDERKRKLAEGEEKDAFLLILTPAKDVNFYGASKGVISEIAADYRAENLYFSEDYYKVLSYYSVANNPQNNFSFRKVLYYENVSETRVHELIETAIEKKQNFCDLKSAETEAIIKKYNEIKTILETDSTTLEEKVKAIAKHISIANTDSFKADIERKSINQEEVTTIEHQEEEQAELEEIEVKRMGAVELMTIVGSKGLSAEHVIIIGFDDVNMNWVTKNAFYVAMTRARKSLHILTALKSGGARKAHDFLDQLPDEHTEFHNYKKTGHLKNLLQNKQAFKRYLTNLTLASQRRQP